VTLQYVIDMVCIHQAKVDDLQQQFG